jgi:D-alanyl-D-alanine carboxypeptidase/D-alanyl-D-alanine-endopeptidase (penicillin-binding protein 4)
VPESGTKRALAALCALALATGPATAAGSRDAPSHVELRSGPDIAARTPEAEPGSLRARRGGIGGERLAGEVGSLIDRAGTASGVWIGEADSGQEVFDRRADDDRILASNTKLFTTATALDRLGAKTRLRTTVVTGGELEEGVLRGNLFLVGDGDPALAGRSFGRRHGFSETPLGRLGRQVRKAGIKRVTGDLLADDTIFDRVRGVPDSNGRTSPYIGPLSGLSYNQNRNGGSGFVANPEKRTAEELREGLRNRGVELQGSVDVREAPQELLEAPPVAVTRSAPLAELVEETNRPSNNFFAETLLKRLDAADGDQGTTKGGTEEVEQFARQVGTDVDAADGSGLTRTNTASPEEVGKLLIAMREQPGERAFRRSLPKAGKQGTLARRMNGTAAEGRCRAKTGTISGVSALSGYCQAKAGTMAFSILMNGVNVDAARDLQDRIAALIARYRG